LLHSDKNQDRCAILKTGAGFADAKLSEILPSARVARFVRMTEKMPALAFVRMTEKDADHGERALASAQFQKLAQNFATLRRILR
jgi:hypothetical protein